MRRNCAHCKSTAKKEKVLLQVFCSEAETAVCACFSLAVFKKGTGRAMSVSLQAQTPPFPFFFRWFSPPPQRDWMKTVLHLSFWRYSYAIPPHPLLRLPNEGWKDEIASVCVQSFPFSCHIIYFLSALSASFSQTSLLSHPTFRHRSAFSRAASLICDFLFSIQIWYSIRLTVGAVFLISIFGFRICFSILSLTLNRILIDSHIQVSHKFQYDPKISPHKNRANRDFLIEPQLRPKRLFL